jgi:hypothetical protein
VRADEVVGRTPEGDKDKRLEAKVDFKAIAKDLLPLVGTVRPHAYPCFPLPSPPLCSSSSKVKHGKRLTRKVNNVS